MNQLLKETCREVARKDVTIAQQLVEAGQKIVNNLEMGIQEGIYIFLRIPFKKSSRQVVFFKRNKSIHTMDNNDGNVEVS